MSFRRPTPTVAFSTAFAALVARRHSRAVVASTVNLEMDPTEDAPAISRDGHWLFFDSARPDGLGGLDHWVSWRARTDDD